VFARLRWAATIVGAVFVLSALSVIAAAGWFSHGVYGDRRYPAATTTVVVPSGATASGVARLLAQQGVIASPVLFDLLVTLRKQTGDVRAGEFRFDAHRTLDEVLREVVTEGTQVATWVTFPEGLTAREIAARLADRSLGDQQALVQTFLGDTIVVAGVRTKSLEGFLFPSTYLIPVNAPPRAVAKVLTDQFFVELPPDAAARARRLGVTVVDAVTIASLIEREAKADDERRLMAGVYYNRLRRAMPLEVDATIEYTFPEHKTVITRADLANDSPYNTYKHLGLPPTPIANPGRASIWAALDPQPSDYLYYVYKGDGHHAFARTLAEHNANVARYLH
jgi:UPF0755 protein